MTDTGRWRRQGNALVQELRFRDFAAAMRFMERVADAAVDYERRPDMCVSEYNRVRLSIGAGRFRLIRQLLTESLVLAVLSGTGGVLLAMGGTRLLSALLANADEGLLLEAGLRMALTRDLITAEEEWRSVIQASGHGQRYRQKHGTYTGIQVWNYILRDRDNPLSVLEMMRQVRTNARAVRNAISGELWRAVNESWMELDGALARPVTQGAVGDVIALVRRAGSSTP